MSNKKTVSEKLFEIVYHKTEPILEANISKQLYLWYCQSYKL